MQAVRAQETSDIRKLLRRAYRMEAASGYDSENVIKRILSSRSQKFGVVGIREEQIIENAYLLQTVRSVLRLDDRNLVDCYYTVNDHGRLRARKEFMCAMAAESLKDRIGAPKWYITDLVREWSHMGRTHDDRWWQEHLLIRQRQLQTWRVGGKRTLGVMPTLHAWLDGIEDRLGEEMRDVL